MLTSNFVIYMFVSIGISLRHLRICNEFQNSCTVLNTVYLKKETQVDYITQVNRMSKSRRLLATGGKQRSIGLHMVCFEMVYIIMNHIKE